jgi:hypothetical protein
MMTGCTRDSDHLVSSCTMSRDSRILETPITWGARTFQPRAIVVMIPNPGRETDRGSSFRRVGGQLNRHLTVPPSLPVNRSPPSDAETLATTLWTLSICQLRPVGG